ncbi:DUF3304 domain-containing protein [Janthinobacterium sp. B9-8]|uniref:DUF3304 domain-containing protein n=1 Tax=Janthinobacterium sp. B9-8 TaxID=1236179 RepID=UPI00061D3D61|nr:DUF3304 domain-containing protein [Janthinobacterium sp. B9-8]AMC34085.1 hypothetical protein VN23_05485 [Janthinobacterium sp. B9-8]
MLRRKNLLPRALLMIFTLFTISACSSYERFPGQNQIAEYKVRAADELEKEIPMLGVSMMCIEHPNTSYIYSYYIKEPFSSRMAGGGSCGGLVAGGYDLPRKWQPGMKVKVRWNRPIKGKDNWIEKYTTIMPYEKAGTLYVHFFENDQVRVVSSPYDRPSSPDHPIPRNAITPPPEVE